MQKYTRGAVIRSTSGVFEPRFMSATHFLKSLQTEVSVITWARTVDESNLPTRENGWIFRCSADYGLGFRNYLKHVQFMKYTYQTLKQINPQVVYACDFETLIPSVIWGKRNSCIIIYDQFDPIEIKTSNWFFKRVFRIGEYFFARFANFRVTANISRINKKDSENWTEIKNLFEINLPGISTSHVTVRQIIFYGGVLSPDRGLRSIATVVKSLRNWKFEIFGQGSEFANLATFESSCVTLHGPVAHRDLMKRAQSASLYLALYDPRFFHNKKTASNKLFEAAQLEIPLLASKNTELGEIVQKYHLGWVVKFDSIEEISQVLRDFQSLSRLELDLIKENLRFFYRQEKILKECVLRDFRTEVIRALELN